MHSTRGLPQPSVQIAFVGNEKRNLHPGTQSASIQQQELPPMSCRCELMIASGLPPLCKAALFQCGWLDTEQESCHATALAAD